MWARTSFHLYVTLSKAEGQNFEEEVTLFDVTFKKLSAFLLFFFFFFSCPVTTLFMTNLF